MIKEDHQLINIIVRAILIEDGKLVVVKWKTEREPSGEMGLLIGGRVEYGEEFSEALIREVKEETGIDVKIERLVYTHQQVFVSRRTGIEIHELGWYFLVSPVNRGDEACPNDGIYQNPDHERFFNLRVPISEAGLASLYPIFLRQHLICDFEEGFTQAPKNIYQNFREDQQMTWPQEWLSAARTL